MSKSALHSHLAWIPIGKSLARNIGLSLEPLAPSHSADDVGLVMDQSVWLEMPVPGGWMVALRLVSQGGQPVIAEVRVFPFEPDASKRRPPGHWSGMYGAKRRVPPGGITARVLRTIRTKAVRSDFRAITAKWKDTTWDFLPGFHGHAVSTVPPTATRGRKGRSNHELARIAAAYEHAYVADRPCIAAVAKTTGLSLTQARDAVHRARVRGLLSPASKQGKGGGLLTPLAQKILKQAAKGKDTDEVGRPKKRQVTNGTKR